MNTLTFNTIKYTAAELFCGERVDSNDNLTAIFDHILNNPRKVSLENISTAIGCTTRTVWKHVHRLVGAGLLTIEKHKGLGEHYYNKYLVTGIDNKKTRRALLAILKKCDE